MSDSIPGYFGSIYDCPHCDREFDLSDDVERKAAEAHRDTCNTESDL